ncbi:unnamed protein product [Cylindrotheca closterium]|uniref:Protochlorophyllide reductase n=1 Tax=Cylindrotheca closterium TaxID=2856 RepID=A0AAD2G4R4_9STRA|nr:unnamed protein product [Cylindrotheca closterium]
MEWKAGPMGFFLPWILLCGMTSQASAFSTPIAAEDTPRPAQYYDDYFKTLPSMEGMTVAITGCSRGLGYVAASTVVRKGGRVLLLNRKTNAMEWYDELCQVADAASGPKPIHVECDLLSFDSVNSASQKVSELTADSGGLDVLCCNAGIMLQPDQASKDGYDITASTNMLSHFLLVKNLFGQLLVQASSSETARVVIMSSASGYGEPAFNPTFFEKKGGQLGGQKASYERYHQSKLANLAFCCSLQEKLDNAKISNVIALACTPGVCGTDMFRHATSLFSKDGTPLPLSNVPNVKDGCMAQLKCIFDPTVQPGELWGPGKEGSLVRTDMSPPTVLIDEEAKKALWQVCEDAVGKFEI